MGSPVARKIRKHWGAGNGVGRGTREAQPTAGRAEEGGWGGSGPEREVIRAHAKEGGEERGRRGSAELGCEV